MLKVNNRNTTKRYKLAIKTPERRQGCPSTILIINFEHISHPFLVFLLLVLKMEMFAWIFVFEKNIANLLNFLASVNMIQPQTNQPKFFLSNPKMITKIIRKTFLTLNAQGPKMVRQILLQDFKVHLTISEDMH